VLYARCIPTLSTPFTNNPSQRNKHIKHLHTLLGDPICLTRNTSLNDFSTQPILKVLTIESIYAGSGSPRIMKAQISTISPDATAVLMLTSGSTGNAKAVSLSHEQVLSAIKGKATIRPVDGDFSCLNCIGIHHVAGLIEIHLLALHFNVDQIHVATNRPTASKGDVKNGHVALNGTVSHKYLDLDLSCLHFLVSG